MKRKILKKLSKIFKIGKLIQGFFKGEVKIIVKVEMCLKMLQKNETGNYCTVNFL